MRWARRLRERFCVFIASAICHASTSLMATASNSSSLPSSFRNSSRVVSSLVERGDFFFVMSAFSRFKLTLAFAGQGQVIVRCLLRLLHEAVEDQNMHHIMSIAIVYSNWGGVSRG